MGAKHLVAALVIALALGPVAACSPDPVPPPPSRTGLGAPEPPTIPYRAGAPVRRYPVGVRSIALVRGLQRSLPTTVWYPAAIGRPDVLARREVPAARGRFPLVLFSHGLSGLPQRYAGLAQAWASAGFVVAAPSYPHTNARTVVFDRDDVVNQPADAAYVIEQLRLLDMVPGDLLTGRIDADHVAAVGHSAGGYTTTGLFAAGHDPRLVAGVVIAGWLAPGAYAGPPASLLFVHGARDQVVPVELGREAYDAAPWPKSFLLLHGRWHSEYLRPGEPGFQLTRAVITNFLRWTLYGDEDAHRQLPPSSPPPAPDTDGMLSAFVARR
jgi:dienelactone hydrolase